MLTRFEDEYGREPGPWVAYGYEAMASALGAIDRADDPLSRSSVVEAYFDGTERDSVLGTYSITEEGETTLDAPLAAYRVEDGEVLPGALALVIYNQMVVETKSKTDDVFHALADSTRRDILRRAGMDASSVSRLADAYPMSFAAVQKHVVVLERAGLVTKRRRGGEQLVEASPETLAEARRALDDLEEVWRGRVERMSELLESD
jgi:DNA-binding transcriptional ArsR family regulator